MQNKVLPTDVTVQLRHLALMMTLPCILQPLRLVMKTSLAISSKISKITIYVISTRRVVSTKQKTKLG